MKRRPDRREFLKLAATGLALAGVPAGLLRAAAASPVRKAIPTSGEMLPVIGLGTWRTFNVGSDPQLLAERTEVVRAFFQHGGGLVDCSPMYGSAADTMGYALRKLGTPDSLFSADKVWGPAGGSAREQVARQAQRWGIETFDLMQVHNLSNWRDYLDVLRELKAAGKIRYIGITTSHGRRHREFEQVMASEDIDFAQLTYNITHREAEERLLPLARERGIAVIANRPYDGGALIKGLKRREQVPQWAVEECGSSTWADFLLKFIISHPAVSCAIPATTRVDHLNENMRAGRKPLPSPRCRQRMIEFIESL
ncbi:aldo/keto reductase [Microbulbifer yueqingensis]|uniref:Aldo/keto reductase n=1 Tax=Microbulbifer yueqingensis TaxID=658219 RepID=A0A1G9AF64_9GAMM|nr:aldo/keto reductase [Microbulbifer yueqingensis]SDK25474.1 Aldo/keto reductase [Microbulbifer yueqingensis]